MKTLTLNTGATIPQLGLGTWEVKTIEDLTKLINIGIENGYRHFDSAKCRVAKNGCFGV